MSLNQKVNQKVEELLQVKIQQLTTNNLKGRVKRMDLLNKK